MLLRIEVDITGDGQWHEFQTITTSAGQTRRFDFPAGFEAFWIRLSTNVDRIATDRLYYQ